MCNPIKAITRAVGISDSPDNSAAEQAAAIARQSAEAALVEQKKARDEATTIAAAGRAGTDKARKAAEKRMRSLLENTGFGGVVTNSTPASVAYRTAFGA